MIPNMMPNGGTVAMILFLIVIAYTFEITKK